MNFVTAALARCWYSASFVTSGICGRARLRSSSSRSAACDRASSRSQELDLLLPGHRHEVHVAEVPAVVLLADAGRPGLRRRLRVEPDDEGLGRPAGRGDRRAELGSVRRHPRLEVGEVFTWARTVPVPVDPEVAGVAGQIRPRLLEERRDRTELAR